MKKMIALSLLIAAGTSVAEEMRPIEKLTYLGEAYSLLCVKLTGAKGNYHAPDKAHPNGWHCYKDGR